MEQVLQQFCLDGTPVSCEPFGNGHINRTFRVTCSSGRVYTLQRINRVAFRHPEELIENIDAVSRFIAKKNTGLEMIRLCTARGGRKYAVDAQGEFWRAYDYISGGLSLEAPRDCNDFYQAAVAFGKFQQALADFPAVTLHETIPRFHDTEDRLCQLRASVEADACGRVREAGPELAFISAREQELGTLCRMLRSGALPLRVTHNDTKLNNVLLDEKTGLARSVLDLDTVMPGLSAYDFGDAVRFGASSAAEDETDLSKVFLRLDMYRAYLEGYLDACGHALTENEISVLPLGAKIITIELGMRFLKDYLDGDVYFKIDRPTQNLDRCRAQLRQGRLRGRPAQIRFAVRHGRRTQRQQGGVLSAQRLYAAQELCDGGGVCTEHADVRLILYLHDGHLLTKKVSAKRVWPHLSGDCDPSGNALASKRHHWALKYKVFSTRHAGREKAVSASGS